MSGGILGGLLNSMDSGLMGSGAQMGNGILGNMSAGGSSPQYSTGIDFLDKFGEAINNNTGLLLGYASNGYEGALQGMRQDQYTRQIKQAQSEKERQRLARMQAAEREGFDPSVADDPDLFRSMYIDKHKRREPTEWERLTQGLSSDEMNQARRYRLGLDSKPASTDDIREYEYAKKDGFQGTFPQFLQSKKGGSNAPSGYAYDSTGKLAPIPGGPQDPNRDINEPLPAEVASRFGLANEYFKRFGGIEKDLRSKDPKSVGFFDSMGFGQSGAIQRDMKLGSEAMIRMLTGAGMNKEEAENEVKQYLPAPSDSAATVLDKQRRLRSALRSMQRESLQGRRSRRQIEDEYPEFPLSTYEDSAKDVGGGSRGPIGVNRASYGAAKGQTRSGVSWSAR